MIDYEVFQQELSKFAEWDAQGMRYGYEIDVEYINGRVQRNESGKRKCNADDFQRDVERLARDNRVGRIFIRIFRGTSNNSRRMDLTKDITSSAPDVVLRVNSDSLAPTLPPEEHGEEDKAQTSADNSFGGALGQLLGLGKGLSGVDVVNGILETRLVGERRSMEIERLREKYAEAKEQAKRAQEDIERLQKEIGGLEGEREGLLDEINELRRYDPRTGQGFMGLAMHLGSVVVGNMARSYATKNPQKFAGLFGPEMLAMVSGAQAMPTPAAATQSSPMVGQIVSWLNSRSNEEVGKVYRLVSVWDGDPTALDRMVAMAETPAARVVEGTDINGVTA